ncbi:MAG: phosphate ABC transporter ATP-binding protein PstB [Mycoplasma sp.]
MKKFLKDKTEKLKLRKKTKSTAQVDKDLIISNTQELDINDLEKEISHKKIMQFDNVKKSKFVFSVENLNVYYGKKHALKNISIDIEKNKVTALIGPSGCGKSTFLRSLNRMNDFFPSINIEGTILFEGQDIYKTFPNASLLRSTIGMVFQKPSPFSFSIYDNIAYAPRIHGIKKKEQLDRIVEKSLKQAALWDEVKDNLHHSALELSGGQQQRLCIARAIALEPEVILLDEPTSALDPIASQKIEELIVQLKERYTIIIVTHSMRQASNVSDNTAFFVKGEIIEYNTTKHIFSKPEHELTKKYLRGV